VGKRDEKRLLRDLRSGRPEAYAELIHLHYQNIYRMLAHLTGDVHEAEDLTQETFVAAWKNVAAFEGRASLATWLYRIAHAKFVDGRRSQGRAASMLERHSGTASRSRGPLDAAIADDEAKRLYRALDQLGPTDRTMLVLHYLQGLSYRDMASVLDEPPGTVKWRTSEAMNSLRALLIDEVSEHAFQ
jgi:RNA polymerase sigma-70 factor, ECF subfamily